MRRALEFVAAHAFLAAIVGVMAGTFFLLYSAIVWADLPDVPHGVLGVVAVMLAVGAGVIAAKFGDRFINRPSPLPNRARARH